MSNKAQKLKDRVAYYLTEAGKRKSGFSLSFAYGYISGIGDVLTIDDSISMEDAKDLFHYMYEEILPLYED